MKLARLSTLEDFRAIENPTKPSKFMGGHKWTVSEPLILVDNKGNKIIAKKWFINNSDELIYSNKNEYFNLRMYQGTDEPSSYIKDAYRLQED
ncbi:MAG: hypothetical protein ACK5MN_03345 [Lachnospiraceae bacterium]